MEIVHDSREGYAREITLEKVGRKKIKERRLLIPNEVIKQLDEDATDTMFLRLCQDKKNPSKKFIILYLEDKDYSETE